MTRLLAFVSCELAEVSATLASLGEARSEHARRAYLEVLRSAAVAASGRELAASGDSFLAVFESASDAVAFAGSVLRGCERASRRSGERLDAQLGIEVGEASWEDAADARASTAAGRAQQLARAADADSVLASNLVSALAADSGVTFAPAGLVELAGPHETVPAVEIVWVRGSAEQPPLPAELEASKIRTRFVGRAAERELLSAAWRQALSGDRQLAFVVGEPGIGKTRLACEFACELHGQGAAVLWGRSFEEALSPYQPFVQALTHHVRCTPTDVLREQIGPAGKVLARVLPELRSRIPLPEPSVEEDESERYRLFEAVSTLLASASAEWPLLLVLDDLQWADPGTLLLLKHLAREPTPAPMLLLGTYRHSEVGRDHPLALMQADVERDKVVELIELTGLAEDEVGELVGGLIGWAPPEDVVRELRGETQGNPFFLEELVRNVEGLDLGGDPERLARVHELGVPARVRELVGRRVQRLTPGARATLFAASIVGSQFDADVLAEVLDAASPRHLVAVLDEAVEARLLVESPERIGRYGFSHALVQQALYEEQTLNRRAALHEQIASVLERLRPAEAAPHAELAYHYGRAGDRHAAKVVHHGRAAGEHALALLAYEDAIRDLSAALAALDAHGDGRQERAELLVILGTAQTRAGEYEAARAAFREAAELSEEAGAWRTLAEAALGYGGGTGFGGIWETFIIDEEFVDLLERALAACPVEDSRERVRLLGRLAQALYWTPDKDRPLALSDEALTVARRLDDPATIAYALDSRHVVLWTPDHLEEGSALAEEMLRLGRRSGNREVQLDALGWAITDALERGSLAAVDELIAEHVRIAGELRQPYNLWYSDALQAMRAHLDGRFAEAEELCEHAYAFGAQAHGVNALQVYLAQTLQLRLDRGNMGALLERLRIEAPAVLPHPVWHAAIADALSSICLYDEALEQVDWFAKSGFASIGRDCLWTTTAASLARAVVRLDHAAYAQELHGLLSPFADRTFTLGGAIMCLGPATLFLGMLARTAGNADLALVHLEDALERSRALESPPLVARTQLETAKTHLSFRTEDARAAAENLLGEAAAAASASGMKVVREQADALLASLRQGAPA